MENLGKTSVSGSGEEISLSLEEIASVKYHDIFNYPLSVADLVKWKGGKKIDFASGAIVEKKNGFYFLKGKSKSVYQRLLRKRISDKKLKIAKKASKILSKIPFIKFVGVTGSLAMQNSQEDGDIDLLIITKSGRLWTARAISLLLLKMFGMNYRRYSDKNQKDKLCLNMWLSEDDLAWKRSDRNIYTAHEIGQILTLVNKDETYESFIFQNKWVVDFWPNSVRVKKISRKTKKTNSPLTEIIFYGMQRFYMRKKMTREVVSLNKALFHPQDWGKLVLDRLKTSFVE